MSALVPENMSLKKLMCETYNEMTDDILHSTRYYIKYIYMNAAVLANLQPRPLKLSRLILMDLKHSVPMATHSFPVHTHLISVC